ncbi:hypothetical protein N7U66_03405 [Lacinutrix neustonica]|uniref:Uncharacterized protein n=1 Tax=Lacinutrix neustonica TaxID=2980107 RepID=A0A9E8MXB9_9FLAO|nr:hypothetical protein [Lacinutrix neustonica]WAC02731.1 hypothetical protein N7U66_03405 [Lacinutrix neustonica]
MHIICREDATTAFFSHSNDGELLVDGNSYALTNPVVDIGNNRITYTYSVSVSPVSGTGINLELRGLELVLDKKSNIPLSKGVHKLPVFRGKFLGTNNGGVIESCGTSMGADFSLYIPDVSVEVYQNNSVGCTGFSNVFAYLRLTSATGGDDFINEYRPLAIFDESIYTLPSGYKLREDNPLTNSAHYYNLGTPSSNTPITEYTIQDNAVNLPLNEVVVPSAESSGVYTVAYRTFEPDCDQGYTTLPFGTTTMFTSDLYYQDLLEEPGVIIDYFASQNLSNTIRLRDYYNLPFSVSPNEVQEGYERTTDWPVQFCNNAVGFFYSIGNPWVALELDAADESTILIGAKDQAGNVIPDEDITFYGPINPRSGKPSHMLVRMRDTRIAAQTCITIYPIAEYRVCENDISQNINLISSWSCDTFPLEGTSYDETTELLAVNSITDSRCFIVPVWCY